MNILNQLLDVFNVFKNMTIGLIGQWEKGETVANRAIKFMENFSLELIERFL